VAGYDLCKLFTVSYGTLGVIVEINFKLRPRPFATRTILALGNREDLFAGARRIIDSRLFPVALELLSPSLAQETTWADGRDHLLLVRFAGSVNAVAQQTASAIELLPYDSREASARIEPDDSGIWQSLAALPMRFHKDLVWRVGLRPGDVEAFLENLEKTRLKNDFEPMWQAGVGDGGVRFVDRLQHDDNLSDKIEDRLVDRIEALRANAKSLGAALIIEHAATEIKNRVNAWGTLGRSARVMQRVKQELDPDRILSPGRFDFENCC
jgi:FAD/FMN-containing dehydrogenase